MKIAIIHEFLCSVGGAEKVLQALLKIYPQADVYSLLAEDEVVKKLQIKNLHRSALHKLPGFLRRRTKFWLPFFPYLVEDFDLNEYDLVISSSNSFAHGVLTRPECLHVCYYHSPMRYVWDSYFSYLKDMNLNFFVQYFAKKILYKIRNWDFIASFRPDYRIANSQTVAQRILKYYNKSTDKVIFPPVEIARQNFNPAKRQDYYVIIARLSLYKRIDQAILACNQLKLKLKIAGTGKDLARLQGLASSQIEFLGEITEAQKFDLLKNAKAFLFPGIDDFGIAPVEAMSTGTPVIAFQKGGASETVIHKQSGILYPEQTVAGLSKAMQEFEAMQAKFKPELIYKQAEQFGQQRFEKEFKHFIDELISKT